MNTAFFSTLKRQQFPPILWVFAVAFLILTFTHFGFYHWLIKAGLLFAVLWIRPNTEFLSWYAINTLCSTLTAYKNMIIREQSDLPFLGLWPSAELFMIGTMVFPVAIFMAVLWLKDKGIRTDNANTFRGMSYLLGAALITGLFLTIKDIVYVLTDGKISEVKAGKILGTVQLEWSNWFDALGSFIIGHFMGAFIGVMIVAPLVMWIREPLFRKHSKHVLINALRYLFPAALLISFALMQSDNVQFFGLLQVLMLAAVVVFSFYHGWRGAIVSIVLISVLITIENHFDPLSHDPKQMQLYVSIVGAMALLFGAAMDDIKTNELDLKNRQAQLYDAAEQKQVLLNQLIAASRRGIQAQDTERQRIAHELHDEVGQSITALQIQLNLLQNDLHQQGRGILASRLMGISDKIKDGVRQVVMDLSPIELNELGLYMAIAHGAFAKIANQAHLNYEVVLKGRVEDLERLDNSTNLAAYRIVQESVTNVIKHAHASTCKVTITVKERGNELLLIISVQDDGVGLNKIAVEKYFISMRDRALALNGSLHIRSRFGLRVHALLRQNTDAYDKSLGSTSIDQRALRADLS